VSDHDHAAEAPANNRQTASFTVRQKILLAAVECSTASGHFTTDALVLRAWELFPEAFSLGSTREHPDSNKVLAKIAGPSGLRGFGWIELTDTSTYRVTRKGRLVAEQLRAIEKPLPELRAFVPVTPSAPERRTKTRLSKGPPTPTPEPPTQPEPMVSTAPQSPTPPQASPASISDADVTAVRALERNDALRKFLRGSPLAFADACSFWGLSQKHPRRVRDRLHEVEQLLERVTRAFDGSAVDVRLPKLSVCYGLLNLHRLLSSRFARELDALAASTSGGAAT
jgi:hypothetical protein